MKDGSYHSIRMVAYQVSLSILLAMLTHFTQTHLWSKRRPISNSLPENPHQRVAQEDLTAINVNSFLNYLELEPADY